MRLSQYLLPILRDEPKEAEIVSHRLMLRAGLVRQASSGIYVWLPLGLRVLNKIEAIIREEQVAAGAIEVLMPTIQSAELWRESGRFDAYGPEMLRFKDRHERDMLYGPTNEEQITAIVRDTVKSYRDLPKNLFHIQWKFRDEIRPRFGVMRGREFLMKDGYSFDLDEAAARHAYHRMFLSYIRTFARMGLTAVPMRADTGPIGGDLSHEFIVLAETGESAVFCDRALIELASPGPGFDYERDLSGDVAQWTKPYAATEEMHDAAAFEALPAERRMAARGIEVGHIFYFGKKYTEAMGVRVQGPDGKLIVPECGSYGIGVSRLVGAIIEASHDPAGIVWPEQVAPFRFGLVNLKPGDAATDAIASRLYADLKADFGDEVLYDDSAGGAGAKLKTMDLIGLPWQIVVGPKSAAAGQAEVRRRGSDEVVTVDAHRVADVVAHRTPVLEPV